MKATLGRHNNRAPGFDTVRLVAASAVALHHSLGLDIDIVRDDVIYKFSGHYTHLGLLAVAVFFAISGFLVTPGLAKDGDVPNYLSRRFMRIIPLLCTVVLATALVFGPLMTTWTARAYFSDPLTWRYLVNVTTFLSLQLPGVTGRLGSDVVNGPLWTLHYEWICYFIVAFASVAGALRRRYIFLLLWLAVVIVMWAGFRDATVEEMNSRAFTLAYLFAYFGAGMLMFLFSDALRWSPWLLLAAAIALLAAWGMGLGYLLAPFLTAYIAVGLGLVRFPWSAALSKVDLSYGVYLTHSLVLTIVVRVLEVKSGLVLFAIGLPVSFMVALATWTLIEKPALRHKHLPAQLWRGLIGRFSAVGGITAQ